MSDPVVVAVVTVLIIAASAFFVAIEFALLAANGTAWRTPRRPAGRPVQRCVPRTS